MRTACVLLLGISLFLGSMAKAEEDLVHFGAHVGMSYAINTFMYGLCRKGFRWDRTDSLIFSTFTTLLVGVTYKLAETTQDGKLPANFGTAMGRNVLGTALSVGTVLVFQF